MKTITAPNGKQYEVEEGWRSLDEVFPTSRIVLYADGSIHTTHSPSNSYNSLPIAWRPIVPPKEKRWRAEYRGAFWYVDITGEVAAMSEEGLHINRVLYSIANYFRTREEAEASNKAKVMRDPESER
jgi:hypothetical protein